MHIDLILCDYGQVVGDKLFINGGGINRMYVPAGSAPYVVTFCVAGTLAVPPSEAAFEHVLALRLETEDDELAGLVGAAADAVVGGELHLPGTPEPAIDDQVISFAFNFHGIPLADVGGYEMVCSIDGADVRRLFFRVDPVVAS